MKMTTKEVGERVKSLREQRNFKKNELANIAGVSPTYINDIEAGRKCPTVEYLSFICDALDVSLSQFFSYEQPPVKKQLSLDTLSPTQKKLFDDFLKSLD